jgi:hypothetical protein
VNESEDERMTQIKKTQKKQKNKKQKNFPSFFSAD